MEQLTLDQAIARADDGIQRADEHASPDWKEQALAAVRQVCAAQREFLCDDIWSTGLEETRENRALGAVMRKAAKLGWCVRTDRTRPSVRSHGSPKPVWRSLL